MKTPTLCLSGLTGRVYIVTRFNKDGSAAKKVDITDGFEAIVKERAAMKRRLARIEKKRQHCEAFLRATEGVTTT